MHPIVARIHPALRTTLLAFLVGRGAYWLSRWLQGRDLATLTYGVGPWASTEGLVDLANTHVPWGNGAFGTYAMLGLGEVLLWLAALALYKVIRREGLPQTADRAVWLWMCSPLVALMLPGTHALPGLAAGIWALELTAAGHVIWGAALVSLAAALAPQAVVLFPGIAAVAFRASKDELKPWLATLLPTMVMAGLVLFGVFFGETPHHIFQAFPVRADWQPAAIWGQSLEVLQLLGALCLLALWGINFKRLPRAFAVASLPAIVAVAVAPAGLVAWLPIAFGVPIWAHLSLFSQDPEIERPLLGASLLALVALTALT